LQIPAKEKIVSVNGFVKSRSHDICKCAKSWAL